MIYIYMTIDNIIYLYYFDNIKKIIKYQLNFDILFIHIILYKNILLYHFINAYANVINLTIIMSFF